MRRRTKWVILGAKNDLRSHSIIWLIGKISYYVNYMPKYTCMCIYILYIMYTLTYNQQVTNRFSSGIAQVTIDVVLSLV